VEKFLAEGWNVVATLRDPAQRAGDQSDRTAASGIRTTRSTAIS
jgi:hypothetical protein